MDTFWSHTASAFTAAVQQAVSRGGAVRDTLVLSYPRLLVLVESTLDKCVRETDVPGVSTSISAVNRQALMHALQPLQEPFLAASLARMQQAVSGLFAPGGVRTLPAAVTQCVGCAAEPFSSFALFVCKPQRSAEEPQRKLLLVIKRPRFSAPVTEPPCPGCSCVQRSMTSTTHRR